MLTQERTHFLRVLIFHGVDETDILVRGACGDHQEQRQRKREQEA
jgi:hypothetical protein